MISLPSKPVIGFTELAKILGRTSAALRVSASAGNLPLRTYRIGHTVVFDLDEVLAYRNKFDSSPAGARSAKYRSLRSLEAVIQQSIGA